jgi:hypothetical protein
LQIKQSNQPDIAVAQEWIQELDAWFEAEGYGGWDPFDIKAHPAIRALQPWRMPRRFSTLCCDLFPVTLRRLLDIAPTENPKTHALLAAADLRLFECAGDQAFTARAAAHLDWLREHAAAGYAGLCWGYPFPIHAKGLEVASGSPNVIISAIAGDAFLRAHGLTGDASYLEAARAICAFILADLPRMETESGEYCFGYSPEDRRRVHNANLLAAELLIRCGMAAEEEALIEAALPALDYTLNRQREDGAWTYGEADAEEGFETGLLAMIDHHHTGFVLRSLQGIYQARPEDRLMAALKSGFGFYRGLILSSGIPVSASGKYPIDIHACAECVLCLSMLSETLRIPMRLPVRTMRWTWYCLRDPETGAPFYRKYPFAASRILFPRWGAAWMYRALAEFLYQFRNEA